MYRSEMILKNNQLDKMLQERNKKISISEDQEVVIFGCGELGKNILDNSSKSKIKVKCFIDNSVCINGSYKGIKVYKLEEFSEIYNDELIILASIIYDVNMETELKKHNITKVISYEFLCEYDNKRFTPYGMSYGNYTKDLIDNKDKYIQLFNEIEDPLSLEVLDNIIMYRITMDKKYLIKAHNISVNNEGEYFDSNIVKLSSSEVFVDGGAYKGETTEKFLNITNRRYTGIYIFEPDEDLYKEVTDRICGENIHYYLAGIGRKREKLKFKKTGGLNGCVCNEGDEEIQIETIDSIPVSFPITYIKLDIEGAELDAIYGAEKTIRNYRPKMAISSYHKAEDLWKLYYAIKSLNNNYAVYIRHYSNHIAETDFYYI